MRLVLRVGISFDMICVMCLMVALVIVTAVICAHTIDAAINAWRCACIVVYRKQIVVVDVVVI